MPPFNRFPILRLPLLPFQLIAKFLTPLDIFSLAVTSYKLRRNLRQLALKLEYLHLNKQFDACLGVKLVPQSRNDVYKLSLHAKSSFEWKLLPRNRNNIWRWNGKQYVISRELGPEIFEIYERTDDLFVSNEILIWFLNILSEIFTFQKVEVQLFHIPKEVVLPVVTTNFRKVHKLCLYNPITELTSDELSSLLEINSVRNFRLNWSVEEGVKYRNSLKCPTILLFKAHWLTIDCILNTDFVSLNASDVLLTIEDLKKLVKKWLEGGFEKLEEVRLYHEIEEMSWKSVMDDFEKKPLEPMDRKKHWSSAYEAENECKIERSDGKRAAVFAKCNSFIFVIL